MGRSFVSVRQGVNEIVERWARTGRALKREDQKYAEEVVAYAKKHSSEGFVGCNDPLEAAVFSVLVEIVKRQDQIEQRMRDHVDP